MAKECVRTMFKLNGGSYPFVLLAIVVLASLSMHRSWSGTGFTMALFIASPAVDGDLLNNAKIGVQRGPWMTDSSCLLDASGTCPASC